MVIQSNTPVLLHALNVVGNGKMNYQEILNVLIVDILLELMHKKTSVRNK